MEIHRSWHIFFVLYVVIGMNSIVNSAEGTTGVFAVPISVDRKTVFSEFYLEVPFRDYKLNIREFKKRANKEVEKSFLHLYTGVVEGKLSTSLSYIDRNDELFIRMGADKFIEAFNKSISKLKSPEVTGAILGNRSARFLLSDSNVFRILTFRYDDSKRRFLFANGGVGSTDGLLNKIYRVALEKKMLSSVRLEHSKIQGFQDLNKLEFNVREFLSKKIDFPAALYFNGQAYYINISDRTSSISDRTSSISESPILTSYSKAFEFLKDGDIDSYQMKFTPASRKKLKKALAKMSKKDVQNYVNSADNDRYIRYVIDTDPVAIVFYSRVKKTKLKDERFYHDYMIKSSDGVYRIANLARKGPLDELLEDDFFITEGLLPLIEEVKKAADQATINKAIMENIKM